MSRHWSSFDRDVTNREFAEIPGRDLAALFRAMKKFGLYDPSGWVVKDYGDDLRMIKAANQSQGRCLFFTTREVLGNNGEAHEELVVLLAYKKETQEAPAAVIERARQRMRRFRNG